METIKIMIEYKYTKVKGYDQKKFLENGHTMFETDVLQRLKRLAYLEDQINKGEIVPALNSCDEMFEIAAKMDLDEKLNQ